MCYLNVQSVKNKTSFLNDFILTNSFDIFALCETWLGTDVDDACIQELLPSGYTIKHVPRQDRPGGGVAIIHKSNIKVKQDTKLEHYAQFECMKCIISNQQTNITLFVCYRPPPSTSNRLTTTDFLTEWCQFLCEHSVDKQELVIVGDMNIHMDDVTNLNTRQYVQSLQANSLQSHINQPTHYKGHTLDVLISRDTSDIIGEVTVNDIGLCNNNGKEIHDHYAITCTINHQTTHEQFKLVSYRMYRNIDTNRFCYDIIHSPQLNDLNGSVDELANRYITGLQNLVDIHAPVVSKVVKLRPHAPWYNESIREAKQQRRKSERRWRRTHLEIDRQSFRQQCSTLSKLLYTTKTTFYSNKVSECKNDIKSLFKITDNLLRDKGKQILPSSDNNTVLANSFGAYFEEKISKIREHFVSTPVHTDEQSHDSLLCSFHPASNTEINNIIMKCANKSCELDPIPTWLLKKCLSVLLPLITKIVNMSLTTGTFPECYKDAIIRPLLKKSNMDPENMNNYRPVSNLHFLSKIIEKVVASRLEQHISNNNLHDPFQSAYRASHSTETALLKVSNDVLSSIDKGKCIVLASLDLSAAFDTVDHSILLSRLETTYGIKATALQWFRSYLMKRQHRVSIESSLSKSFMLSCGVPQGSVLGARMYTLYTKPLSEIFITHDVIYHTYADDTQAYIQCESSVASMNNATNRLGLCIDDVCEWMRCNALKLNESKTEFVVFNRHSETNDLKLHINGTAIKSSNELKCLGVTLDNTMSLDHQITNTCRSASIQLRKINYIKRYLNESAIKTIVQAVVLSRLDYCNSLYNGLNQKSIQRLQLTQNKAVRIITGATRRDHITPIMNTLTWLPIKKRCQYKLMIITYKALHNTAPQYFCDLLNWYKPTRSLRSQTVPSLVPSRSKTIKHGRRLCDTSAATLWNSLPNDIRLSSNIHHFKRLLKLYLLSI